MNEIRHNVNSAVYGAWVDLQLSWTRSAIRDAKGLLTYGMSKSPHKLGKLHFVVDPVRKSVSCYAYRRID